MFRLPFVLSSLRRSVASSLSALIVTCLLAHAASAATYFVAPASATPPGNDSNGGSEGAPWLTIQKALDTMATGDTARVRTGTYSPATAITISRTNQHGKTLTVEAYGDGVVTIAPTDVNRSLVVSGGSTWSSTSLFTFRNIKFAPPAATFSVDDDTPNPDYRPAIVQLTIDGTYTLVFDTCTLAGQDNAARIFCQNFNNSATGNVQFLNCTMNAGSFSPLDTLRGSIAQIGGSMGQLYFNNCSITAGRQNGIHIAQQVADFYLYHNTWATDPSMAGSAYVCIFFNDSTYSSILRTRIDGEIMDGITCKGILIERRAAFVDIANCRIRVNDSVGSAVAVTVGRDGSVDAVPPGRVYVRSNFIEQYGSQQSHGIIFGRGITSGLCAYNRIIGGDYAMAVKCERSAIEYNVAYTSGSNRIACIMRSGVGNTIAHNTFYSANSVCFQADHQSGVSGANSPADNVIFSNIFAQGSGNTDYCVYESNGANDGNMDSYLFDRNVYARAAGGSCGRINSTGYTTLANLQAGWDAYANNCSFNDSLSVEGDPEFYSLRSPDYIGRLAPWSIAKPVTDGPLNTNIGAWQGAVRVGR